MEVLVGLVIGVDLVVVGGLKEGGEGIPNPFKGGAKFVFFRPHFEKEFIELRWTTFWLLQPFPISNIFPGFRV